MTKSGVPLFDTEFQAAHGVVWDQSRQLLWALGYRYLRAFRLADWNTSHPWLDKVAEYPLPDNDGHDLSPVPGTGLLALTTGRRAWFFDRDRRVFSPHPQLGVLAGIKSISVHPVTGRIAWTQADKGFWWTATLRFLKPDGTLELTGQRLYKVRWATMPK